MASQLFKKKKKKEKTHILSPKKKKSNPILIHKGKLRYLHLSCWKERKKEKKENLTLHMENVEFF